MKRLALLFALVLLISCKSKSVLVDAKNAENIKVEEKTSKVIGNFYHNKKEFSTLYIKSAARFQDEKQTQNVSAEIKIKKNEQILISIRFFGITMAKAMITPLTVSYYEKINSSYFEGDFSSLSQWLGTDLDFYKIQNMLIGNPFDDLNKGKYAETLTEIGYRLDDFSNENTKKSFFIGADDFLVKRQEISQTAQDRRIQVAYADNKAFTEAVLPLNILINTFQKKGNTEINLEYNSVTFNEELSFPYSIPNGYKRIIIK